MPSSKNRRSEHDRKFDYGKDNLASKYTYPSGKTATYSYDSILRRNRIVINTTTPIDHQYVYWMSDRGNNSRTTKIGWEHISEYIYGYTYKEQSKGGTH